MKAAVFLLVCWQCSADVYLHSPRSSNNRLNEQNVNRDNNNRLFDSQNNNKGGYSVGVDDDDYENEDLQAPDDGPAGYVTPPMDMVEGAPLPIEWTNQHACGPNVVTQCEVVLQYIADDPGAGAPVLRDGEQTGCNDNNDQCPPLNNDNQANGDTADLQFGNHEPVQWYLDGRQRDRNNGLFTADQNVNDEARTTRQNPNGGRSGTENSEERDYYPYFTPTPWKDIVALTSNISRCVDYQIGSQNVAARGICDGQVGENNEEDCLNAGGAWTVEGTFDLPPPDCQEMLWTRDNHLGNGGVDGYPVYYNWTLPPPTGESQTLNADTDKNIVRLRYNITTGDAGGDVEAFWDLTADQNGGQSPVQQDEAVNVPATDPIDAAAITEQAAAAGAGTTDQDGAERTLQTAINTNQYGRVFEDRTYVVHVGTEDARRRRRQLQSREDTEVDPDDCSYVHNLAIRGKRGNIVESYPSVEHDFLPQILVAEKGDCIHLQVWLTDNDPPNNAGEGLPGTGRANIALMDDDAQNSPITSFEDQDFFDTPQEMFKWTYQAQEDIAQANAGTGCLREDQVQSPT